MAGPAAGTARRLTDRAASHNDNLRNEDVSRIGLADGLRNWGRAGGPLVDREHGEAAGISRARPGAGCAPGGARPSLYPRLHGLGRAGSARVPAGPGSLPGRPGPVSATRDRAV